MKTCYTMIFFILFLNTGCQEKKSTDDIKFNRNDWLQGDLRLRGKMVNNIISDSILIGKTKQEVLQILGEQADTSENFSYPVDIGLKSGPMGLGGAWIFQLQIHFDSLGQKAISVHCDD